MVNSPTYGSDPNSPNTTYVQADPTTFRAVVQRLTGAPEDPSSPKLPLTLPARYSTPKPPTATEMGPRRPAFKLHERRHATKKLELSLNLNTAAAATPSSSSCGPCGRLPRVGAGFMGFGSHEMVMASPVSTLDFLGRGSPRTPPASLCEEEDRAIAGKGFYLHPSPLSAPRGMTDHTPELLPLFPLQSPRDSQNSCSST
ncbi:hypothetical protein FF1_025186 [Malus domestica]